MNNNDKADLNDMCAGELRLMCAQLRERVAQLEDEISADRVIAPVTLEVRVHIVNDDTGQIGSAVVGLSPGRPVTRQALYRAIGQTLAAIPTGFRLAPPDDFFNKVLIKEKTGRVGNFATPSSFHYDVDALIVAGLAAQEQVPAAADIVGDPDDIDEFDEEDL